MNTLTERQKQYLNLLAVGFIHKEIGSKLHVSPHTVKSYLSEIYEKMGVKNGVEAVAIAIRGGEI